MKDKNKHHQIPVTHKELEKSHLDKLIAWYEAEGVSIWNVTIVVVILLTTCTCYVILYYKYKCKKSRPKDGESQERTSSKSEGLSHIA